MGALTKWAMGLDEGEQLRVSSSGTLNKRRNAWLRCTVLPRSEDDCDKIPTQLDAS